MDYKFTKFFNISRKNWLSKTRFFIGIRMPLPIPLCARIRHRLRPNLVPEFRVTEPGWRRIGQRWQWYIFDLVLSSFFLLWMFFNGAYSVQQRAASVVKKCSLFVSHLKANRTKNLKQPRSSNRLSITNKISMMMRHMDSTSAKRMERATASGRTLLAGLGRRCLVFAWIKSVLSSGIMKTPRNAKIYLAIAVWPCCNATAHFHSFRRLVVIHVRITYPNNLKRKAVVNLFHLSRIYFFFIRLIFQVNF